MILTHPFKTIRLKRNRQPNERLAISNNQHTINMSTASIKLRDGSISVNRGNRFIDRTGLVYGNLTVLNLDSIISGNVRWICRCKCGVEKSILARALNQGQTGCGCGQRESLVGTVFGRLKVVSDAGNKPCGTKGVEKVTWKCLCDCGKEAVVSGDCLRSGKTRSCGCLLGEAHMQSHLTHGFTVGYPKRTYRIWSNMKTRCSNPKSNRYKIYGGRGIRVCEQWQKFDGFLVDMGECPEGMSLERKDRDKGYGPDNCKWATTLEQANNTCTNRFLEFNGKRLTIAQWAREVHLPYGRIAARLKRGWTTEKTLATP